MPSHLLGHLQPPAVLQIRCNSGRAKTVTTDASANPGFRGAPLNHLVHIRLRQRISSQRTASKGGKQGSRRILGETRSSKPLLQILLEGMVAGHLIDLAAFSRRRIHPRRP